jgi:hypothetical protein
MNESGRTGTSDHNDDRLLTLLRESIQERDPVPAAVLEAARGSFTWRTIDAELAEIAEDSALTPLAGVRGGEGPRLITFESPSATVVVEVTVIGRLRRLLGQLVAPRAASVEVRHSGGAVTVEADELGRFAVDTVPAGPVSLACRFLDAPGRPIVTTWVTV